jgi:uncharacterized protein YjbJ (UPF0337 family)
MEDDLMDKEHVKGSYEEAKGAVRSGIGDATGDRDLKDEGFADRAQAEVRKRVGDIKDAVSNAATSAEETVRPLTKEIEARIQRNPTGALLMAAGAGLVLAFMLGRRR